MASSNPIFIPFKISKFICYTLICYTHKIIPNYTFHCMGSYGRIIFAIIGLSSSFIFCQPTLKKQQTKRIAHERLKMISAALEEAEGRVMRVQERHDRLLAQICSYYVCHKELEEAIVGARKAMDDEMEFAATLRKMQLWILATFPDHVDLGATLS